VNPRLVNLLASFIGATSEYALAVETTRIVDRD
jgi:hypothetical protein